MNRKIIDIQDGIIQMGKKSKIQLVAVVVLCTLLSICTVIEGKNTSANDIYKYRKYIKTLSFKEARSIGLALKDSKKYITGNVKQNDQIFRVYYSFYQSVLGEISEEYSEGKLKLSEADLKKNGITVNFSEAGDYLSEKPGFIYSNFHSAVSNGLKKYLEILNKELNQTHTYLVENMALSIGWDQLADRMIDWEDFIKKYPNYPETKNASDNISFYLYIYTASELDNTPLFIQNILNNEVKKSYERFIDKYQKSAYQSIIKGYYDVLKNNNFILNDKSINYLKQNHIDTKFLEDYLKRNESMG